MGVADRMVVMSKGRVVKVLDRRAFDAGDIVTAATGVAPPPERSHA
jgi:ABC-type sugar transport system ATPase subunit